MFICVWHLLTAMCLFAMGCYEAPDYTATRFRCDPTHACPGTQVCVSGACSGGGNDSGTSDPAGVSCGAITCAADQQCCLDFITLPHCTALGASCDGIAATCDGLEDCRGNACCEGAFGLPIVCGSTPICPSPDQDQICRDADDCTNPLARQCCLGVGLPAEPWGRCRPGCPPT
jgi:hypothetical protein